MVPADEQQHRKGQIRPQGEGIHVVHAHIALHLQGEGLGDGLAAHVDVVVQAPLLDVIILQLPAERPDTLAGQIVDHLHAEHEIEVDQGVLPLVPY